MIMKTLKIKKIFIELNLKQNQRQKYLVLKLLKNNSIDQNLIKMEEPKTRDCAFQVNWDEDEEEYCCQFIEGSEGDHWCDKNICPFWGGQKVTVDIKNPKIETIEEFE